MLGDAVNTAFRIQNLTRFVGHDVLASGELFESWPGWPEGKAYCIPLGLHELRGKTSSVNLYSVQSCPAEYS